MVNVAGVDGLSDLAEHWLDGYRRVVYFQWYKLFKGLKFAMLHIAAH